MSIRGAPIDTIASVFYEEFSFLTLIYLHSICMFQILVNDNVSFE